MLAPWVQYVIECSLITELVFTVLFLKILYWIYEVVIHSRIFILDLPANIDFWNLYKSILVAESVCL
jgi:hypothetical protein